MLHNACKEKTLFLSPQLFRLIPSKLLIEEDIPEERLLTSQHEIAQLKRAIIDAVFFLKEEESAKHFITCHHSRLIYLSDMLMMFIDESSKDDKYKDTKLTCILKAIFLVMYDLLAYIRKNYSRYCDCDQKIPDYLRCSLIKELTGKITEITTSEYFEGHRILRISLLPIQEVVSESNLKISFYLFYYLKELVNEIQCFMRSPGEEKDVRSFRKQLISINFNSNIFIDHVIHEIKQEVSKTEVISEQIDKLSWFLKRVNQVFVKPRMVYYPKRQGVNEFVSDWLTEEIGYLEKKLKLLCHGDTERRSDHNFKIITDMSVSQIACLTHLLVVSGVINNPNQRELIEFVASHTQSKRRESITFDSLRSKYYNISESTRQDIKELVIKLLNKLRDM
jgi:hypothetical protein